MKMFSTLVVLAASPAVYAFQAGETSAYEPMPTPAPTTSEYDASALVDPSAYPTPVATVNCPTSRPDDGSDMANNTMDHGSMNHGADMEDGDADTTNLKSGASSLTLSMISGCALLAVSAFMF